MGKWILAALLPLAACVTAPQSATDSQKAKAAFLSACQDFDGALATATAALNAGKLNQSQVDAIGPVVSEVYPICHSAPPTDQATLNAMVTKVTAAVTTLTTQAVVKGVSK